MTPDLIAVVPTLGERVDLLNRCLDALGTIPSVVVVDALAGSKPVSDRAGRTLWTGGEAGFAGTAQLGIQNADCEFVLLLNDDAWIEPHNVARLADVLSQNDGVAGSAPKILLASDRSVINSVGTVLAPDGWSDNRGIGETDTGQYDKPARVFGCHFAVAVLRRRLFESEAVGPIDTSYKLYYEDVDWCLRANLMGWTFVTEPEAVAFHEHSATVSPKGAAYSFRYQERNLLWTVAKCFAMPRASRVLARRSAAHVRNIALSRPLAAASATVLKETAAGLPGVLAERRRVQSRRVVSDEAIFGLSGLQPR